MFLKSCCFCRSNSKDQTDLPSISVVNGVHNNCYETWEPITQQRTSSVSLHPKLSKGSHSSYESIQLSKIDLKLNLFENCRFDDMSAVIHKNNIENINHI